MKYCVTFITTGAKREATSIANLLVEEKVAACVNIVDNINSVYRWQDEIQEDKEYLLIAKTRRSLLDKLIKKVNEIHTYSCPEIISFPIEEGNPNYLNWIKKNTTSGCINKDNENVEREK